MPTREAIEERFKVPAISVTGTDDWLGEWTFSLPQGSMTDEPIFWADLIAKRGHSEVGVLVEQSLVGESYMKNFRRPAARKGIRIVAEEAIAQTAQDVNDAVRDAARGEGRGDRALRLRLRHRVRQPGAARRWTGIRRASRAPRSRTRGSTRSCGTRSSAGPASTSTTRATRSARSSSIATRRRHGRRPEYCVPVVNRDIAATLLHAFADAHPLSPRGVKEALERVKMLPAASGAPGHPGLVRQVDPPGMDGRRLPRGPHARSRRRQLAPGRPLRRGRLTMTTQESTPPDHAGRTGRPAAKGTNWGRCDRRCWRWLGFLGLFAAVARTDVDPRVANPNVEGRPRPVEFLTGFDHWQVIPQIGALIMVVVLTSSSSVAGGKTPAARC